jgi:hypothetical protein
MVERKNFQLPMALGLFRSEEEGGDPDEVGFLPEHEVHTDLQEVFGWHDFDEWVGRKLDMIHDCDFWSLEFMNVIPPDFVINIANQADLDEAITDILFKITLFVLGLVGLHDYQFADPFLSRIGVGDFDFCFVHAVERRPLLVVQTLSPWDSQELADADALDANYLQRMYGYLMFNHVSYGAVTSYNSTRFVRLISPGKMLVSEPYPWNRETGHTVVGSLVALALHCSGVFSETGRSPPFFSKPNQFMPIFKRGKFSGSVRWDMDRVYKKQNGAYFVANGQYYLKDRTCPAVVKCFDRHHCTPYQMHLLTWEKEMYDRLQQYQDVLFPKCLAHGTIWDMLGTLVLAHAGRPLTPSLMQHIPNLGHKMMAPVRVLHSLNLVHGDIQLRNFVVDHHLNIKLVSLNRCIYTGATKAKVDETVQVRALIRIGMQRKSHARLLYTKKPHANWRHYKRRSYNAGWQRYNHSYVKLRNGPFITAVRKSSIL